MLEFIQAVMAASSFGHFVKTKLDWSLLPLGLKWSAAYLFFISMHLFIGKGHNN